MNNIAYQAYVAHELSDGTFTHSIDELFTDNLPQNGTLIKVEYSSLNYKDALSASGNKGVTRRYPHTPGIDACGYIVESDSPGFKAGDKVLVTGYDMGMNTSGGFGQYINVPTSWVVRLPDGFTLQESMLLGTAGFTAALALHNLLRCGFDPQDGELLVTGASGGVGSLSIAIAAANGFNVTASTGKLEEIEYLKLLGAKNVIDRSLIDDKSSKLLLRPQWAAAIDTVGGNTLATILKALLPHGSVACCGNVASPLLNSSVFPFILNGVNLLGVNSATTPMPLRQELWQKLAAEWKPDLLKIRTTIADMHTIHQYIELIRSGKITGRVLLQHS